MNPENSSIYFKRSILLYDYFFTNKKYNVKELKSLGAKQVYYFKNGYSPEVHHPIEVAPDEKSYYGNDVSFIGTYEKERVTLLNFLVDNNISVKIWGWGKSRKSSGLRNSTYLTVMDKHVYDEEYAKVICASKINLCFLRKINRDTETTRSVEIPACKGFMLAERTAEHQDLFKEGIEAEYYSTPAELLEKIRKYLSNDSLRTTIAKKGYDRCMSLNLSYRDQLQSILEMVANKGLS